MKAIVVNCSSTPTHTCYNLGARKLADWLKEQGYHVAYYNGDPGMWELDVDLVCLSVIFSWHAQLAREIALRMKDRTEVWCGGPGMFALASWWRKETGLEVVRGLDERFDKQRGSYAMTFASRGCPVNCSFCIVPRIEGTTFTFDPDFNLAPVLCDNNLSALPQDYQDHIIQRYLHGDVTFKEANSGFEPHYFDEACYHRWKPLIKRGPWRFALDEMRELEDVRRMMHLLKDEPARQKRVYVLVGNEPVEQCYERAMKVIEWGGEPHCQFVLPLNLLDNPAQAQARVKLRYNWQSYQQGKDFCRYFNTWGWRSYPIWTYAPRVHQPCPFHGLKLVQGGML
jgi:pyruvate-formate lyase-activating enzyme